MRIRKKIGKQRTKGGAGNAPAFVATFHRQWKKLITEAGSAVALHERIGGDSVVSLQTVRDWGNGVSPPRFRQLVEVATALGKPLDWLVYGRGSEDFDATRNRQELAFDFAMHVISQLMPKTRHTLWMPDFLNSDEATAQLLQRVTEAVVAHGVAVSTELSLLTERALVQKQIDVVLTESTLTPSARAVLKQTRAHLAAQFKLPIDSSGFFAKTGIGWGRPGFGNPTDGPVLLVID